MNTSYTLRAFIVLVFAASIHLYADRKNFFGDRAEGIARGATGLPVLMASGLGIWKCYKKMRETRNANYMFAVGPLIYLSLSQLYDSMYCMFNWPEDKATSTLLKAIREGDIAVVENMIESGVDINRAGRPLSSDVSIDGHLNPINAAAYHGKADIIRFLIKHKAKVGSYTLAIAAQNGHAEAVKALVEDGKADINTGMSYATGDARKYLGQCYLAMDKQQQSIQQ